ncbi:uncharacterized protein si:ch1073-15f19.2 isoform X6 [Gadus morhua]|uniref:uncharacterized protein si:ch1073-15f19.2 isoform X6 n=1 Tax=Gadus morhua TaxID=8049 RepID=UPI0011B3A3F9|nr:uncharacterized protein LOC115547593 isoform X6 [Gadus morhua]
MMCFENLNMPADMSRAIFSLLLFGTALQGLEAVKVIHFAEAAVGQNISLPCILNDAFDTKILQIEWGKKSSSKLVVYNVDVGTHYFRHDVKFQTKMGDNNTLKGSYLQLFQVQVNDSGTYVCDLTTFPKGSISRETRLEVKELSTGVYFVWLAIIPCLVVFFVLGVLYRKYTIRKRQDRLAPFKPPPPPEKHGSVEPDQILTENRFPAEKARSDEVQPDTNSESDAVKASTAELQRSDDVQLDTNSESDAVKASTAELQRSDDVQLDTNSESDAVKASTAELQET